MNVENELKTYIRDEVLRDPAQSIADDEQLISTGRIDSLGLIQILTHISERYRVDLMRDGNPDDFESVRSIAAAIKRRTA
ncbi:MAG: acyl carrier protein [Candidatus Eisenbacteria bacterium]|uniref:Acyl carrier protein n=1 Tax=Eiseniibacteriota bacterium TaxID=2212470 RepID=A0A956RS31_UNCEI|nr:acyl carrier protein [Candidatus Eisenbacteria bacterium]